MLACVVIRYVEGRALREENFGRRRKGQFLSFFFFHVADCVRVSVDARYSPIIITYAFWLKLCGHRRKSVPDDINDPWAVGMLEQLNLNMQT
jgi:hypothetical protein